MEQSSASTPQHDNQDETAYLEGRYYRELSYPSDAGSFLDSEGERDDEGMPGYSREDRAISISSSDDGSDDYDGGNAMVISDDNDDSDDSGDNDVNADTIYVSSDDDDDVDDDDDDTTSVESNTTFEGRSESDSSSTNGHAEHHLRPEHSTAPIWIYEEGADLDAATQEELDAIRALEGGMSVEEEENPIDAAFGNFIFDHLSAKQTAWQKASPVFDQEGIENVVVTTDYRKNGTLVGPNRTVLLGKPSQDGESILRGRRPIYFHIKEVVDNQTKDIHFLHGWFLRGLQEENDHVYHQPNNLALAVNGTTGRSNTLLDMLESVSDELVIGECEVIFTNVLDTRLTPETASNDNAKVCKYLEMIVFLNRKQRRAAMKTKSRRLPYIKQKLDKQLMFRTLRKQDGEVLGAAKMVFLDDSELRKQWLERRRAHKGIIPRTRIDGKFTMMDFCCGPGGATQGARAAGLIVLYGLDYDEESLKTYQENHPGVEILPMSIQDFLDKINSGELRIREVDVVHLSLACAFFSPAHTRNGKEDNWNQESFLTITDILAILRPLVVTFEQTSGLDTHHVEWKQNSIRQMTELGFSIHWKLIRFHEISPLPQKRTRFILCAAAPGQTLPEFPPSKYGPGREHPFATVADAISFIEEGVHTRHAPSQMATIKKKASYDIFGFAKTVTKNGGAGNYYYTGERESTVRELATFQGFPLTYEFIGTDTQAKKDIGNAFPPPPATEIFKCVISSFDTHDAVVMQ